MLHDELYYCVSVIFQKLVPYDSNACYHSETVCCELPLFLKGECDRYGFVLGARHSCERLGEYGDLCRIFSKDILTCTC